MMDELKTMDGELTTADLAKNGAPNQLEWTQACEGSRVGRLGSRGCNFGIYSLVF